MSGICYIFVANPDGDVKSFPEIRPGEQDLCIAADAGLELCQKLGVHPDILLGDFDSLLDPKKLPKTEVITFAVEKDDTDTLLAIKHGLEKGYKEFVIVGGVGGRLDHTIANIASLYYLAKRGARGCIISDKNRIYLARPPKFEIKAEKGFKLSIFPLFERAEGITLKGTKYPLKDAVLDYELPIGVSNEFLSEKAEIYIKKGHLLVILSRD